MNEMNPFKIAQAQLDEAARIMDLDPAVHELLRWPRREFHVTMPVRMDDGTLRVFKGYRVQYNDSRGPTKGGLRFHPDETIDTVRALAAWMTWKTSCIASELPTISDWGWLRCSSALSLTFSRRNWPRSCALVTSFSRSRIGKGLVRKS